MKLALTEKNALKGFFVQTVEVPTPVSSLRKFFSLFGFKLITVSVLPPEKGRVPLGKWFDSKNWIRAIPFEEFFTDEVQLELQNCNAQGCGIYFTINEGDGIPGDPQNNNFNCGKRTNIKTLRCLAIDTDNANNDDLKKALGKIGLIPHAIIESSSNRFHYYFMLEPVKAEGESVIQWQSLQRLLDDLVPDLDQSMTDINQVLRIPGFFNFKYEPPFKVFLKGLGDRPPFNLNALYHKLDAGRYNDFQAHVNGAVNGFLPQKQTYNKFEFPKEKLKAGERRTTLCRYIEHLMENVLDLHAPEADYLNNVDGFIINNFFEHDWKDFLEGGKRRQNIVNYLRDQRARRIRLRYEENVIVHVKAHAHQENLEAKTLPDSFYLNFPGDLGLLVREIYGYAPNLSLELCFAGALMISGALKAETFRFKGSWPFVNGLVIAGTGAGKSTLKDIVERTLQSCGLRGKYPQLFGFHNSVQSLHTALYTAGGAGTVIIDESGDYLQTITSKHAPAYAKAIKKYLKEASTGKDQGTWLHPGGSLSYNVPPINGGMLSLWMLIQPDMFTRSLDLSDMADGFIPRFFTFNGITKVELTRFMKEESGVTTFKPSIELQVYLESLVSLIPCLSVDSITQAAEKELKESFPKAKMEVLHAAKRDAVYLARSEARKMNNISVNITEEAHSLVLDYLKEQQRNAEKSYNDKKEGDSALGVYVRMEEMLMRLMCNAVSYNHRTKTALIDKTLAENCIDFHRFNTDRFFSNELKEIGKSPIQREEEAVLKAISTASTKKGKAVTLKEISLTLSSYNRPKNLKAVLKGLVDSKEVWMFKRPHNNKKKIMAEVEEYRLPEAEEKEPNSMDLIDD